MNILPYIIIFFATLLPFFESRLSIPIAILLFDLNPLSVFIVVIISNFLAAIIGFLFMDFFVFIIRKIKFLNNFYEKKVIKLQKKIQPKIESYGWIALATFIGIPVPGSGVYSGALIAKIVGMDRKTFCKSVIFGIIGASIIVLLISIFAKNLLIYMGYNTHTITIFKEIFGI